VTALAFAAAIFGQHAASNVSAQPTIPPETELAAEFALLDPRVQALDPAHRLRLVSFVIGNTIFVLTHELGHAFISEFDLPVLGKEEDAADTFATLAFLLIGTDRSRQFLVNTAQGLWLKAEHDKSIGREPRMYGEHSLNLQRAYQIVCLMVGSGAEGAKEIAGIAKMPEERQESCRGDFEQAAKSWSDLLKEHRRTATAPAQSLLERLTGWRLPGSGQNRTQVRLDYQDGPGQWTHYRSALMKARLLEQLANLVDRNFALPRPMTVTSKTCNEPEAHWDARNRQLVLCYELVAVFVELGLQAPEPPSRPLP
jgi:putative metallopeptidase DUF4344